MLLHLPRQFLFVHVAKTAGSSVRVLLSRDRWRDPNAWLQSICHRASQLTGHRIGAKLPRHAPIVAAQEMLAPDLFDGLYKFAFVRSPWDRLVSAYCHFQRERQSLLHEHGLRDFDEFARWLMLESANSQVNAAALVRAIRRPQREHLVDLQGHIITDFVGRYENLDDDLCEIFAALKISHTKLPHRRRSHRERDYRTYYTDELAELVGAFYESDCREFGYRFDANQPPQQSRFTRSANFVSKGTDTSGLRECA